jgi:hypothetical protein
MEVEIQAVLVFGLRRIAAMQPPTSAETEHRDTPPLSFLSSFFSLNPLFSFGWIPVGTRLGRLVRL